MTFKNITILLYGITRRQELDLILQTGCCGGLNLFRVSNYDDIFIYMNKIFDDQCLILYPVNYPFEYLLHEVSDMLHIWDMHSTQCVVPIKVKERAFWPFSILFAT